MLAVCLRWFYFLFFWWFFLVRVCDFCCCLVLFVFSFGNCLSKLGGEKTKKMLKVSCTVFSEA